MVDKVHAAGQANTPQGFCLWSDLVETRLAKLLHLDNITAMSADFVWPQTKFTRCCMLVWTGSSRFALYSFFFLLVFLTIKFLVVLFGDNFVSSLFLIPSPSVFSFSFVSPHPLLSFCMTFSLLVLFICSSSSSSLLPPSPVLPRQPHKSHVCPNNISFFLYHYLLLYLCQFFHLHCHSLPSEDLK